MIKCLRLKLVDWKIKPMISRWCLILLFANLKGMNREGFDALIVSIKNGEFKKTPILFSQCTIIWPDQVLVLMKVIDEGNLRTIDYPLYYRLQVFAKIYFDAVNGKLQFNDHYLNCFKSK